MPDPVNPIPPPGGDTQRAESYIKQIIQLLTDNKLITTHTDLTKFDPNALQDHYRINVGNYQIEISHSKQPQTGKDMYVLLFINSPSVDDFYNARGIIAYLLLNDDQFKRFKAIADEQIETRRKVEEEKRFAVAVKPIDELLQQIGKGSPQVSQPASAPEIQPPTPEPAPPKVEVPKTETPGLAPTMKDVQNALRQAAVEAPTPPPSPVIPIVETIPPIQEIATTPPPVQKPEPVAPPPPAPATPLTPEPAPPVQPPAAPTPAPQSVATPPHPQQTLSYENVLTSNTPTGSEAPPPSGLDQAIDQAFQHSGNTVAITNQTPPIGIN